MKNTKHVLIVGAGPVGLLLAINLLKANIAVTLIEKRSTRSSESKALSMNAASLKILHAMGIVDRFLECGQPVQDISVYWNNKRLMHVDYRRINSCYQYILSLPQPETERLLEDYFTELGGHVQRGVSLLDVEEQPESITAHLSNGEKAQYDYVVGCDGARSTVRDLANQTFVGHDYGIYFLLIDTKIQWGGPKDEVHYFVKDAGFIIVIPLSNGYHRIVIKAEHQSGKPEDVDAMQTADFQKLVDAYGPGDIEVNDIIWQSSAPFYNRLSSAHQQGRMLLAGDASHLFSPIGGMGMNTGFQDAYNLGWKLAGVLKGQLSEQVLETYHHERQHIAKQLLNSTDITTRLIARVDKDTEGKMQQWLPTMKNRQQMAETWPNAYAGLSQRYESNLLNQGQGHYVGQLLPYVLLGENHADQSSYDLIDGLTPVLIVGSQVAKTLVDNITQMPIRTLQLDEATQASLQQQGLAIRADEALLIRPDGYVGWHDTLIHPESLKHYLDGIFLQQH